MSGPSSYQPRTGIERWLDARLPIVRLVYDQFVAYPTPINLNYSYAFGAILIVFLIVQIVSGIVLAMHYVGHESQAFASIEHIMRDVNYGWLIRYIHMNGASFFFFAAYVHTFRGLYYGSYKAPREMLWILGIILLILMMATAFMGYVLPWGQMSFWGATVITNLFSALPYIGEPIVTWLWGGYTVGGPTLTRFYSLHYLLPFVIAGVVVLHVWALHICGQNNPTGVEPKLPTDTARFTPYALSKDAVALGVVLLAFAWFVFYVPNYLGHADNYVPANPGVTPSHIVPEWYLLPFYAILRAIPSKLGGVLSMFGALIVLMFLPWLDTSKVKSARYRPIYRVFYWLFVANCLVLGWLGAMPPEGIYPLLSRVCTVWYFGHFLVLVPLIGRYETPRPLPESITADVLVRHGGTAGPAPAAH